MFNSIVDDNSDIDFKEFKEELQNIQIQELQKRKFHIMNQKKNQLDKKDNQI